MRRAARIDDNQREIVEALRKAGATVRITAQLGDGFPDLLVRPRGRMASLIQMETKRRKGKLTPAQVKYFTDFPETLKIETVEEALRAIGVRL